MSTAADPAMSNPSRTASSAGMLTPTDRANPERWVIGKPYSSNYYYDEITTDELPPDQIDLSDYWVVKVVRAGIGAKERLQRWPAVFTSKTLKSAYQNKGAASKVQDVPTGKYYYETVFGTYEMHGTEGRAANYIRNINRKSTSKNIIGKGRECKKGSTISGEKDPTHRNAPRLQNTQQKLPNQLKTEVEGSTKTAKADVPATAKAEAPSTAKAEVADRLIGDEYKNSPSTNINKVDPTRTYRAEAAGGDRSPLARSETTSLFGPDDNQPKQTQMGISQEMYPPDFGQPSYPTAGTRSHLRLPAIGSLQLPDWKQVADYSGQSNIATTGQSALPEVVTQERPLLAKSSGPSVGKTAEVKGSAKTAELGITADAGTNPTKGDQADVASMEEQDLPATKRKRSMGNQGTSEKKRRMTFGAEETSSSSEGGFSSSEYEEDSLRETIDSLRAENTALNQRNYQLQQDWKQTTEKTNREYKTARAQFIKLAGTTTEIHAAIHSLVARTKFASSLLKKTNKYLPAHKTELTELSIKYNRDNVQEVEKIVSVANSKIEDMAEHYPELSRLLFDHGEKCRQDFENWMAEAAEETAPSPHQTTIAEQTAPSHTPLQS